MTENKQLSKCKAQVYELLEQNRLDPDSNKKATHLSYGSFMGKFVLNDEQRKKLIKLYSDAIKVGVNDFSILELPKDYGPIIVDIDIEDLKENWKDNDRLYDNKLIKKIIKKYLGVMEKYLSISHDIENNTLKCFVFEKKKPTEKDLLLKDGFHLIFPDVCVHSKMRHLIRKEVVEACEKEKIFEEYSNKPDKIIDEAVVSRNGWFMYGSKKPGGQLYSLTKVYNGKAKVTYDHTTKTMFDPESGTKIDGHYKNKTLIKFLSIQNDNFCKDYETPLNLSEKEIEYELQSKNLANNVSNEIFKYEIPSSKEDEINRTIKLINMLNDDRAESYHNWLHVGLALHSIDDSLLPTWIDFSKRSNKFKEGECERVWKTMKNPTSGNILTVRSVAYWAKNDNPKLYEELAKSEFKNLTRKISDANTYYIAKSVYAKYSDRFVCSSIKTNSWWEFKRHRWTRVEEGYSLKNLLSDEFANEYNKEIADISLKATEVSGIEKKELEERRFRIDKIVEKLRNNGFKNALMDECKSLFYDPRFEEKLDSNINLIGFENGIYDLEQGVFREGRPDDYITLSTKNDYYKWSEKNPYHHRIMEFFNQVLPNKSVRDYFLNVLCTCLSGQTKEEKLYVMTGCGSNGKSLTMDLMYQSLGEYYMSCDISMITRKRGQSNQAAPEKVRMKGRRCGVYQEADDGEKLNVGIMKELTGGDKILIRDLFKGSTEMIEFKPQMKYFLTCNQLPEVPSNDDGTWRRIRVIEFGSKFCDNPNPTKPNEFLIDNTLKHKIELWAPAFLSYLIHIYNTEYKNKTYLTEPSEVMVSTKQYKMENDHFTEYADNRIDNTGNKDDKLSMKMLWEDFKIWFADFYGGTKPPKPIDFNKFIIKNYGEMIKNRFVGIRFKDDDSDSDDEHKSSPKQNISSK